METLCWKVAKHAINQQQSIANCGHFPLPPVVSVSGHILCGPRDGACRVTLCPPSCPLGPSMLLVLWVRLLKEAFEEVAQTGRPVALRPFPTFFAAWPPSRKEGAAIAREAWLLFSPFALPKFPNWRRPGLFLSSSQLHASRDCPGSHERPHQRRPHLGIP